MSDKHDNPHPRQAGADHTAWDEYWRNARGAACQGDESGRYRGIIGSTWRAWFAELPARQRVLDLATGNGAVIELAVESVDEAQLPMQFHGVDQALIRPRLGRNPRPGVRCHWYPAVVVDDLPFAAGMFDAVTSQYGVEYGDLDGAVNEIRRVLRPGGRIFWICHLRHGDIARDSQQELEQARHVLAMDLPRLIVHLMRQQQRDGHWVANSHQATRHTRQAQAVQQALSQAFRIAGTRPGQPGGNLALFLNNLAHLYQYREEHGFDEVTDLFGQCERELRLHLARIEALVNAALTDEQVKTVKAHLETAGLRCQSDGPIIEPDTGRVVGYGFRWFLPDRGGNGKPSAVVISPDDPGNGSESQSRNRSGESVWSWSEYWREGAITTFADGGFEGGYDDVVASFWEAVFDQLADSRDGGARVVDLACGNGAVALLAARRAFRADRRWQIIGVDSADISLPEKLRDSEPAEVLSMLELHRLTPMERTGIAVESVDLVISQFGIEYGDPEAALSEAYRICRPSGHLALLMHHPESTVVTQARQYLLEVLACLKEPALSGDRMQELARLSSLQSPSSAQRTRGVELAGDLQTLRARLLKREHGHAARVVENYLRICGPEFEGRSATDRLAFIESFGEALRAYIGRMQTLDRAVMDEAGFADFLARLKTRGWKLLNCGELRREQGELLARKLLAHRSATR